MGTAEADTAARCRAAWREGRGNDAGGTRGFRPSVRPNWWRVAVLGGGGLKWNLWNKKKSPSKKRNFEEEYGQKEIYEAKIKCQQFIPVLFLYIQWPETLALFSFRNHYSRPVKTYPGHHTYKYTYILYFLHHNFTPTLASPCALSSRRWWRLTQRPQLLRLTRTMMKWGSGEGMENLWNKKAQNQQRWL